MTTSKIECEFVIIGGGVAGLCAAISLVELGASPFVVEAGSYPSHKVCGEFISPDSIPLLKQWGIHPIEIKEAHFHAGTQALGYRFSRPAGALSHLTLDPLLAHLAASATLLIKTRVVDFRFKHQRYELTLSSGVILSASSVIIATGRIPHTNQPAAPIHYMGIKAHFKNIPLHRSLEMFFFKGAYAGIAPIEGDQCNIACLAKIEEVKKWRTPAEFMNHLMEQNRLFKSFLSEGVSTSGEWLTVQAPRFGLKTTPDWPSVYFIGDAACTMAPVIGNGLTLAIKSGKMVAAYAIRGDYQGFKQAWKGVCSLPSFLSNRMHEMAMRPLCAKVLITLSAKMPSVVDLLFRSTRIV